MNTTLSPTETLIDSLVDHFSLSFRIGHRNLDGISHDESLVNPQQAGNCMHWVVRHVVNTRDRFLPSLGQKCVLAAPAEALRLEELITAWGESQDRLVTGLRNLTEAQLESDAPFNPRGGAVGKLAPFLLTSAFHEAYHVGQLGILRRILGKPGVM